MFKANWAANCILPIPTILTSVDDCLGQQENHLIWSQNCELYQISKSKPKWLKNANQNARWQQQRWIKLDLTKATFVCVGAKIWMTDCCTKWVTVCYCTKMFRTVMYTESWIYFLYILILLMLTVRQFFNWNVKIYKRMMEQRKSQICITNLKIVHQGCSPMKVDGLLL